jgi:hypothetical protein
MNAPGHPDAPAQNDPRSPLGRATRALWRALGKTPRPAPEHFEEVVRRAATAAPTVHFLDTIRREAAKLLAVVAAIYARKTQDVLRLPVEGAEAPAAQLVDPSAPRRPYRIRAFDAIVRTVGLLARPDEDDVGDYEDQARGYNPDAEPLRTLTTEAARLCAVMAVILEEQDESREARRVSDAQDAAREKAAMELELEARRRGWEVSR